MCGIAGGVFWNHESIGDLSAVVRAMTNALAHRGPDGEGLTMCMRAGDESHARGPRAVLGHRRLAIIDLTDRAAQPMTSPSGVTLTFNGEIYNFKEIRRELESYGRRFRSDSDTEVVLQGYEQWGEAIVNRLRGMYAFAIWDPRLEVILLARDRLGIKPLYLHRTSRHLLFASEVRSLLASGLLPRQIDLVAVDQFLAFQSVAPPRTLVRGVEMMPPATCFMAGSGGQLKERRYWDLLGSADRQRVASDSTVQVGELLEESTRLHLVSDVPVGVFLSSGVDSTAVAALVRRAGAVPRTFCVSFPGTRYDEGPRAREIAAQLGAEHVDIPLAESECRRQIPQALAAIDHPSADGVNTYVVSHAVSAAGLKVALSGLGGDELFGGYPSFRRLRQFARYARAWRWSPAPMRRIAAATVRSFASASPSTSKAAALLETDGGLAETYPVLRQLFPQERRRELLGSAVVEMAAAQGNPYVRLLDRALERCPDAGLMSLVSYAEARTYMHDVLLRDTDQMSMRHGLEVRVPLLDHQLVEYVMGLPDDVKQVNGIPKRLLVDAVGGSVLREVAARPKQGFVMPFDLWMRDELRDFCEASLGPTGAAQQRVLRADAVKSVWLSFLNGSGETWSRPWALVALNAWMETTGVSA